MWKKSLAAYVHIIFVGQLKKTQEFESTIARDLFIYLFIKNPLVYKIVNTKK